MSIRTLERNGKTVVAVGVLVLFVVAGVAGTATATTPPGAVAVNQTVGEVEIVIVEIGNNDSMSLVAPNGNRSIPLKESQRFSAGTSITIVETKENRTVPDENYFTTGATKTEEQKCWISHVGLELGDGIRVNESVDIPCDGGEIAGSQNLESIEGSDDAVLIEPEEEIEYQNGTYGVINKVDGVEGVLTTFTVGSGGPSFETNYDRNYDTNNDNNLYGIIGIIAVAALLVMASVLVAVGLQEVFTE
jgi:hypothetical protein